MSNPGERAKRAPLRGAIPLLLIGALVLLGMSYLFLRTLAGGMARHTEVVSAVLRLETLDGRIHREVLACRTRTSADCGAVSALAVQRGEAVQRLDDMLPAATSDVLLGRLQAVIAANDSDLVVFVERNQRLHEALLALPLVADSMHRSGVEHPVSLGKSVDDLLNAALQLELRSNETRAVWRAAEAASTIQSYLPLVEPVMRQNIERYLALIEVIVAEHQAIEHLLTTLASQDVVDALAAVQRDYAGVIADQERDAETGTALLYLLALALFVVLVGVSWRLIQMHERLEVRVEQRTEELRHARDAAMASVEAKAAFLATMSHELRTPMNGVLGMAQLLRTTPLSAVQSEFVDTIDSSGSALLTLINDILDFSSLEDGELSLECVPMSIASIAAACERIVGPMAAERSLRLTVSMGLEVRDACMGDPARLRQVLLSLLSNAIKFTAEGGVVLQISQSVDQLCFSVTDTGIGVPEARLDQLFDLFSQVDSSSTRRYGGTGLGLAMSRQLVSQMGGEIGVRSVEGQGSTFWFVLPCIVPLPAEGTVNHAGI